MDSVDANKHHIYDPMCTTDAVVCSEYATHTLDSFYAHFHGPIYGSMLITFHVIVQELCVRVEVAVRPNEPSGFRGRKAILNHASALVSACP